MEAGLFDGEGGAVAGELEEVAVLVGEVAWGEAADVQDAEDGAFDDQGDAEQGLDALLAQDRVEDVGVVDVGDGDGAALGGDAAREAAAEGDAHALFDFLLDALGGAGVQRLALEQEDRDGVDLHDVGDPLQQLLQQVLLRQVGQRRIGHPLQRLQPERGTLGRDPGEALAAVEACLFDGEGGAVGGELEEVAVLVGEVAWGEAADVQDAEDVSSAIRGRRAGT